MHAALYHNLPPGGARRAAYELAKAATGRLTFDLYRLSGAVVGHAGDDPNEGAQNLAPLAEEVFEYRLPVTPLGPEPVHRATMLLGALAAQRRMATDINARGYDVVIVHPCQLTQAPALLGSLKAPSVYYVQEPRRRSFEWAQANADQAGGAPRQAAERLYNGWVRRRDIEWTRRAGRLLANSRFSLESVVRAYGRYPVVCELGVDPGVFAPANSGRDRHGVVSVGALDATKGHDLVIEALACLPPAVRPSLTVVYERERPRWRTRLVGQAESSGVNLSLRRGITDEELGQLYRQSIATVCAASLEPFGLTAVESLACGTPVVAVREGGFREVVIHGETGLLVERSPREIAAAVEEIMGAAVDPRELHAAVVPFWTWESAGHRFADAVDSFVTWQR